ncbi:MAG: HTTM domain-containing protein [Aeromicrobium sp.]
MTGRRRMVDGLRRFRGRVDDAVLGDKHALVASAVCRIGTGLAVLGLLASNLSTRDLWVGQGSVWAEPARAISTFPELVLLDGVSADILTLVYGVTMLAALALVVGWHAKAATVVTFIGFIAVVGQNPVVGSPGDNLIRLTLLWMLLMRTSEHWSLDAWRRRRRIAGGRESSREEEAVPEWLSTGLHNVGLFALGTQIVLASMAAGLDKVADRSWQQGTALYSTMQLPEFRPFPGLSDVVSGSAVLLALLTYGLLLSQLFFGPLLLNPYSRRIVVALAVVVNVVLGVVFGQPWSAVGTIAVIALFVSDDTWLRVEDAVMTPLQPVADWFVERGFDVVDRLDDLRYRLWFPVVDWVRASVLRR